MGTPASCAQGTRPGPPRRALLALAVSGCSLALLGCESDPGGWAGARARVLTDDERRQGVAIAATRRLRDATLRLATRLPAGTPQMALLPVIAAHHLLQLQALGDTAGADGTATPTSTAKAAPTRVLGATPLAPTPLSVARPEDLAAAQADASALLAADAVAASPGLATLLARLAAAQYVHARLLAPQSTRPAAGPTSGSGAPAPDTLTTTSSRPPAPDVAAAVTALQAQLAAEHAAVYAYGVLTARSSGQVRALAEQLWTEHETLRGRLRADLVALGAQPTAAEAAYTLPRLSPPELAALVEAGSARAAAAAVAVDHPPVRAASTRRLAAAAWRQARWGLRQALPGS